MSASVITQRAAATSHPSSDRLVPTRAGIINLWDYRDEEFVFADGWLVLRGPNGSGKTKALEVLFPFVLDGRIEPRRLNPFAGEDRTMKSNLLFRGQDSAFSYVWLEFGRGDEYVTVGVGMRAQRHNDRVTRWYFVADGRVGVDFSLLDDEDRPVVRKHLAAQIGADAVRDNAAEHRAAVDARVFGLGRERYEQLLNLVLTLRRPQLAKDLDPASLSQTLTEGLRPIDDDLVTEAARSFDDMEAVQHTLDGLVAADEATRAFLATYSTYLRTHARMAADGVGQRRDATAAARQSLAQAQAARAATGAAEEEARAAAEAAEREPERLLARLDALKASAAYQSRDQLIGLERLVRDFAGVRDRALADVDSRTEQAQRRAGELAAATRQLAEREAAVTRAVRELDAAARAAGIAWGEPDMGADGLLSRISARVAARRDDIVAVRQAAQVLHTGQQRRDLAAAALAAAVGAADEAATAEREAATAVTRARDAARTELQRWHERHAPVLADLRVTHLAPHLEQAIDRAGEADADDPRVILSRGLAQPLQLMHDERTGVRADRSTLEGQRGAVAEERERIAAETDDAPPAASTRPASRAGRAGAPLWRLVRFADDVPEQRAAAIEAALEAADLLDAWLHPTDRDTTSALASGELDGYVLALPAKQRPAGATLADVLVPEEQEHVDTARIAAVLSSVALTDAPAPATTSVTASGAFAQGIQVGAYTKPAVEYIGATARQRRRAARIADCDQRLAELDRALAELDRRDQALTATIDAAAAAERDLPAVGPIVAAQRVHAGAAGLLRARRDTAEQAAATHDHAIAEVDAALAMLRRTCAERALAAEAVDDTAAALRRFEVCGNQLASSRREASAAADATADARQRVDEAVEQRESAAQAAAEATERYATQAQQLETLREAVGADAAAVEAEVTRTEAGIEAARRADRSARAALVSAAQATAAAAAMVSAAAGQLQTAWIEEQRSGRALAPFAQPDLLDLLRCPPQLHWPAENWPSDVADDPLPADVAALLEAILASTRELTPTESSVKQSTTRATKAFEDLQAQLSAAGQDHHPEWIPEAGIMVVFVADADGRVPIKAFADRISRDRRDQEVLLTEAEQRILEDTLLSTLARQIHQRSIDARDLVDAMDREMRARRMSSGVTIGVGWHLADTLDEEQRAICKVLEKDPARLGPGELATLRRHFATRIKAARAVRDDQTYRELLSRVLDYRGWRTFSFRLHRPGAEPEALTRAKHSQLSGGEQSVSLHLPLFAAAHALFQSARPTSPRLLALDEAFAGVDDTGRAELMSLAVQFDLDLFMTGYDLWATYASVPGCAHYDLSHSPLEHTVSALLLVWDGAESIADLDGSLAAVLGSPGTRSRPGGGTEVALTEDLLE